MPPDITPQQDTAGHHGTASDRQDTADKILLTGQHPLPGIDFGSPHQQEFLKYPDHEKRHDVDLPGHGFAPLHQFGKDAIDPRPGLGQPGANRPDVPGPQAADVRVAGADGQHHSAGRDYEALDASAPTPQVQNNAPDAVVPGHDAGHDYWREDLLGPNPADPPSGPQGPFFPVPNSKIESGEGAHSDGGMPVAPSPGMDFGGPHSDVVSGYDLSFESGGQHQDAGAATDAAPPPGL
jgi:hypothetical protein